MKRFFHNVVERIKSMRRGRTQTQFSIFCDSDRVTMEWLTIENQTGSRSFSWNSVSKVKTFKRDLCTFDCICLAFETPDGWVEFNEDMQGWSNLLDQLQSHLPGFPPQQDWWPKVMQPAFATNERQLWTRTKTHPTLRC
jgi:hypothetical protein